LDFSSLSQGVVMGDLLVIGAGVTWAFFMLYNKPLVRESSNIVQSMAWLLFFTLLPLLLPASLSAGTFGSLPLDAWLAIFYTAIFCWVIPYYLWLKGLRYISAVTSSVVLLTEVIVAVAIATLALGEVLTVVSGVGAIFIITAILLVS
jgi:drug/metabolite transporter (DMT)-like permease